MRPPFPSCVENWHNDTYPAISPKRLELSAKGKRVVITGGGTGLGRGISEAFAVAGATAIVITGRRLELLEETKQYLEGKYDGSTISVYQADVTDVEAMNRVADEVGKWDILIHNAGFLSTPAHALDSSLQDWWQSFETNVKGTFVVTQAFFKQANANAVFVATSTSVFTFPNEICKGMTAYQASKLALTKYLEIFAHECPNVRVHMYHPGLVATDMVDKAGIRGKVPEDSLELAAHFTVWLCSKEAAFTCGRMVSANFDIDELKAVAAKLPESTLFLTGLLGWSGPSLQV